MSSPKQAKAAAFMRKAVQYFEAGDLAKAQKNVSKYLSINPTNADANHLAGLIANHTGKPDQAITLISRALKANPRIAMAHNNLGEAYRTKEQFAEAEACYRKAIELEPQVSGFYNNLGIVVTAQRRVDEAIKIYQDAIENAPRDSNLRTNLGNTLLETNDVDGAIAAHQQALKIQPKSVEARCNLGIAIERKGDFEEALKCFEAALELRPDHIPALTPMAATLEKLGKTEEAISSYERIVSLAPDDDDAYVALATLLRFSDRPDDAVAVLMRLLERQPDNAVTWAGVSFAWRAAGEKEKAQDAARKALAIDPSCAQAHAVLAQVRRHKTVDDELLATIEMRKRKDLPAEELASINFGLGKAFEELEDYEAAIDCLKEANRLKRSDCEFSIDETAEQMQTTKSIFNSDFFSRTDGFGTDDKTPIFILGMPRSGTSLVEQIVSSHSSVFGAGELQHFTIAMQSTLARQNMALAEFTERADQNALRELGENYIAMLRAQFGDAARISDKMPHNFLNVGLIRATLPQAKIIHCQRHPMDTCLSIYKNNFSSAHNYAYDMIELGTYYRQYRDLMAYWRETLPGFMYEISYEALVADTETEARKLLEFCQLEWEPECLEFYKTKRVVNTISASQVREPIYTKSVALWKKYGEHLQPLIDALGDAIET